MPFVFLCENVNNDQHACTRCLDLTLCCFYRQKLKSLCLCVCVLERDCADPFVKLERDRERMCVCISIYTVCWKIAAWMRVRQWVNLALLTAFDGGGGRPRMKDMTRLS